MPTISSFRWPAVTALGCTLALIPPVGASTASTASTGVTTSTTKRVSVTPNGVQADLGSYNTAVSANGRYVAFMSQATNLAAHDNNGVFDVFVRDRVTHKTWLVSRSAPGVTGNGDSNNPSISANGRYVAFDSNASDLTAHDTNNNRDVFVYDRVKHQMRLVSRNSSGVQGASGSEGPSISDDGRYVAFSSGASNLIGADTNNVFDVFVHDRVTHKTGLVSRNSSGVQGNAASYNPSVSATGRLIAFDSAADNLIAQDGNGSIDVFVYARVTHKTRLVSRTRSGAQGNDGSDLPSISANGRMVAFQSLASNFGSSGPGLDVFVYDRQTHRLRLVSRSNAGVAGNGPSRFPSISADGRVVVYASVADNLVGHDTNASVDVFAFNRTASRTRLVSQASAGTHGDAGSDNPSPSSNGKVVAFESNATNLIAHDTNNKSDIFARAMR